MDSFVNNTQTFQINDARQLPIIIPNETVIREITEGFCWTDINSTHLKSRLKAKGVYDVVTMTLFSQISIPDWFFVSLINTRFISEYVDAFINNTSHFQINDARQLPIIIPGKAMIERLNDLFNKSVSIKMDASSKANDLTEIEGEIEKQVLILYGI